MRAFCLLVALLVAYSVVMATAGFEATPLPSGATLNVVDEANPDDTPRPARLGNELGNEVDDLRDAVFGRNLRFERVGRLHAAFTAGRADRIDRVRDAPPDRPPRALA